MRAVGVMRVHGQHCTRQDGSHLAPCPKLGELGWDNQRPSCRPTAPHPPISPDCQGRRTPHVPR
ncbi:uncharacterized protein EI90DRAFT_3064820, partial [Cantharellus anzutake]|uniref:uncharacterized protein n=1 Tax=Cantharellus anzutake TaxID=1750568 RepID=UPI001902FACE